MRSGGFTERVRASRKTLVLATVVVLMAGAVRDANAGWPVTDIGHTITSKIAWAMQYQQMLENLRNQIESLKQQAEALRQKLVGGAAYKGGAGYREALKERDINAFVDKRCGDASKLPGAPTRVKETVAIQFRNCVTIVQTENRRYNVVAKVMADLAERDKELDEIRDLAGKVPPENPGELERLNNNIAQVEARMSADMQNSRTLLEAYDAHLRVLNNDQVQVGRSAFRDDPGLAGSIVQYGALKVALKAARSRER